MNEQDKNLLRKLKINLDKLVDATRKNRDTKANEHLKEVKEVVEKIKKKN